MRPLIQPFFILLQAFISASQCGCHAVFTRGNPRQSCWSTARLALLLALPEHCVMSGSVQEDVRNDSAQIQTTNNNFTELGDSAQTDTCGTQCQPCIVEESTAEVTNGINIYWLGIYWSIFGIVVYSLCAVFLTYLLTSKTVYLRTSQLTSNQELDVFEYLKSVAFVSLLPAQWGKITAIRKAVGYGTDPHYGIAFHYNALALMPAVLCSLLILCGSTRAARNKWVAIPLLASLVPVLHAMVVTLSFRIPICMLGIQFSFCALNLVCVVTYACCAAGLFVNGRPAAAYLLPYYHVCASKSPASDTDTALA